MKKKLFQINAGDAFRIIADNPSYYKFNICLSKHKTGVKVLAISKMSSHVEFLTYKMYEHVWFNTFKMYRTQDDELEFSKLD